MLVKDQFVIDFGIRLEIIPSDEYAVCFKR